jgi:hypothetical protein
MDKVMFEAADPSFFNWYIREFGIDVTLLIDHSQDRVTYMLEERYLGKGRYIWKGCEFQELGWEGENQDWIDPE